MGLPQRRLPQQLQRQKGKVEAQAAKAKPPAAYPTDEAARKVAKGKILPDLLGALVPSAMIGRKTASAHAPAASMPTHLVVGRAQVAAEVCPAGEERAKAATSPGVEVW